MPEQSDAEQSSPENTANGLVPIATPRVMVAGTSSQVGAATIALGLVVAYKQAGAGVCSGIVGNSLITATQHRRVCGRFAHLLDPWMLSQDQLIDSFARLSTGSEIAVIATQHGLFDERPADDVCAHDAELAFMLGAPIILVIDARGFENSVRAMIYGFSTFYPQANVAGVIANHVQNAEQGATIRDAIQSLGGPIYLGGIPDGETRNVEERQSEHYFLNPSLMSRNRILEAGSLIKNYLDLDAISKIAESAKPLYVPREVIGSNSKLCRIAVADDAAFQLTVQDNFDILRRAGAELVAFSPLADSKLPPRIGGIYFPSGYIDLYVDNLSNNKMLNTSILDFAQRGGAIYAEGNALAYLFSHVVLSTGEDRSMVGLMPGHATFTDPPERSPHFRYCMIRASSSTAVTAKDMEFRGMREPRLALRLEGEMRRCFQLTDRRDRTAEPGITIAEGLMPTRHTLATMVHAHWGSNPQMGELFLRSAQEAYANIKNAA